MDVNDIMQNLATVVNEQGDMLDNIESNMTVAEDRVESGVEQLVRTHRHADRHPFCVLRAARSVQCAVCYGSRLARI